MQLHEVKEVKSVSSTNSANDALSQGWTLIAVVSDEKGARYVLGKGEAPPKKENLGVMMPERLRK